jgi:hypothetical protein
MDFKKWATLRAMVASRPKVSFDRTAAPAPKIMDYPFYVVQHVFLSVKLYESYSL